MIEKMVEALIDMLPPGKIDSYLPKELVGSGLSEETLKRVKQVLFLQDMSDKYLQVAIEIGSKIDPTDLKIISFLRHTPTEEEISEIDKSTLN